MAARGGPHRRAAEWRRSAPSIAQCDPLGSLPGSDEPGIGDDDGTGATGLGAGGGAIIGFGAGAGGGMIGRGAGGAGGGMTGRGGGGGAIAGRGAGGGVGAIIGFGAGGGTDIGLGAAGGAIIGFGAAAATGFGAALLGAAFFFGAALRFATFFLATFFLPVFFLATLRLPALRAADAAFFAFFGFAFPFALDFFRFAMAAPKEKLSVIRARRGVPVAGCATFSRIRGRTQVP